MNTEKRRTKHRSDGSIGKGKLARAYAPELSPHAALNRLNHWLRSNKSLWRALTKHGYFATQKILTKEQKRIIYRYLGSP